MSYIYCINYTGVELQGSNVNVCVCVCVTEGDLEVESEVYIGYVDVRVGEESG